MKIPEFQSLQMVRTDEQHFGQGKVVPVTYRLSSQNPVSAVSGLTKDTEAAAVTGLSQSESKSFQSYLLEAVNTVNNQQLDVSSLQEKLITNPDDVDIHDVTIAMSKARMSLNLVQTVIDRLVTDWNEITTTR